MSTTERNAEFGVTHAPGIERPLADEPVHRRGDDGVAQVDLQLVEPRLRLLVLRLGEIELRRRRLKPRLRIVVGLLRNQLAVEQVLRAIEVRLREPRDPLRAAGSWPPRPRTTPRA